jgi:hypothetical protein
MIFWILTLIVSLLILGFFLPRFCYYDIIWDSPKRDLTENIYRKFSIAKPELKFIFNKRRLPVLLASLIIFLLAYFLTGVFIRITSERFTGLSVILFTISRNCIALTTFVISYFSISLLIYSTHFRGLKQQVVEISGKENLQKKFAVPEEVHEEFGQSKILPKYIPEHYEISA